MPRLNLRNKQGTPEAAQHGKARPGVVNQRPTQEMLNATPAALRPRMVNGPGIRGRLPIRAGKAALTEHEAKNLRELGWKDGEPLPPGLADFLQAEQKQVQHETENLVPDAPVFQPPKLTDIAALPKEQQESMRQSMQQFRQMAKAREVLAQEGEMLTGMSESVRNAYEAMAGQGHTNFEIVDSRTKEGPADKQVVGEGVEPQPHQPQKTTSTVGFCPRCGWDTQNKNTPVLTDVDKMNYVQAVLGGQVFRKSYALFDGYLQVSFRGLSNRQSNLVTKQIMSEMPVEGYAGLNEMYKMLDYRMTFALDKIFVRKEGGGTIDIAKCVDTYFEGSQASSDEKTMLPEILAELRDDPLLNSEQVWRMLRIQYQDFNTVAESLELKASEKGFWNLAGA